MPTDPVTMTYQQIWACLEAYSAFTAAVPTGNRIKITDSIRDPFKHLIITEDTPQVTVLPMGCKPTSEYTTNSTALRTLWSVEVLSGQQQYLAVANLDWIVYRALLDWRTWVRAPIDAVYGSMTVQELRQLDASEDMNARRAVRAPKGWISVWMGKVDLTFDTETIAP